MQAKPAGLHPPFSFRSCRKENGPCTVQKKRRSGGLGGRFAPPASAGGGWLAGPLPSVRDGNVPLFPSGGAGCGIELSLRLPPRFRAALGGCRKSLLLSGAARFACRRRELRAARFTCRGRELGAARFACRGRGLRAACFACRGRGLRAACFACRGRGLRAARFTCVYASLSTS